MEQATPRPRLPNRAWGTRAHHSESDMPDVSYQRQFIWSGANVRIPHTIAQIKIRAAIRKAVKDGARKAHLEQQRAEAIKAIDKVVEEHRASMKRAEALATTTGRLRDTSLTTPT